MSHAPVPVTAALIHPDVDLTTVCSSRHRADQHVAGELARVGGEAAGDRDDALGEVFECGCNRLVDG